ncbi:helix-turn-helix domain-containing protein [Paraglaciecola sp. L3A3]|uniref:helix-turn-helix domain-containing protein n=1 Tax=Paraglaciecola sp. L3A3 TaxID=2686358 RepID=UPI00131BE822|nr:helix-turn-helix domain-containing protein [Paraglaciecola sp. L3A3]
MSTVSLVHSHPCKTCHISDVCLGSNLQQSNCRLTNAHRIYHRKNTLFSAGDEFLGIYVIRSGSAKALAPSQSGDEHISKFHFAGEIMGLDGFANGHHSKSIEFLETSSICFISVNEINILLKNSDDFNQRLLKVMSSELIANSAMSICYSVYTREQRLAKFLLDLSTNFIDRGQSGSEFLLSMTRTDIANYLGMAIETVCRVLGKFQEKGIIDINQRMITINQVSALTNCLYGTDYLHSPEVNNSKLDLYRASA